MEITVASEEAMHTLAARFAEVLPPGTIVYLHGPLGVGKTTFVRGVLRTLGHVGAVHSPTYTLLETYPLENVVVCHSDLYRLADPSELEYLGLRERLDGMAVCFIEWPEHGVGVLPPADFDVDIRYAGEARHVHISAHSERARHSLGRMVTAPHGARK